MDKLLFTGYQCDRCAKDNAVRMSLVVGKDIKGDKVQQKFDLCSVCIIGMCSALFNKVDIEERESWITSFVKGIIN